MQLFSWLHKRVAGRNHTKCTPARRFRPRLEALEDRCVPSTLTVTNNLDSGAGSLRSDIAAANPGDTINFAPSVDGQTINLTSGQLAVGKNLTIQGPGAGQLAISGGNRWRVFEVNGPDTNVMLSGLTITQGNAGLGGGIYTAGNTLTISGCTLSNNHAQVGGGVYSSGGTLQIINSALSGNKAANPSGGGNGGAVYSSSNYTVSLTGCTFSNNSASYEGGAIFIQGPVTTTTISGCTFSGNVEDRAVSGWGSFPAGNDIYNAGGSTKLTVSDSIFSNNTPYRFDPMEGLWTNGGGNTFNY